MELVQAAVAGLSSRESRFPTHYCSLMDTPPAPGKPKPAAPEVPLPKSVLGE
jgi:hypothetical protein